MRYCIIAEGSLENEAGQGDGAYSLLDVEGTPEEIGKAIADALADCDLACGAESTIASEPLYLNLRIKVWQSGAA